MVPRTFGPQDRGYIYWSIDQRILSHARLDHRNGCSIPVVSIALIKEDHSTLLACWQARVSEPGVRTYSRILSTIFIYNGGKSSCSWICDHKVDATRPKPIGPYSTRCCHDPRAVLYHDLWRSPRTYRDITVDIPWDDRHLTTSHMACNYQIIPWP